MVQVWLLVEWVDEDENVFPHYGVVNMSSLIGDINEIHPGKIVYARNGPNSIAKAQILRVSERKRRVKELKVLLQRQDNKIKNVLSVCMKTINNKRRTMCLPKINRSGPSRRSHVLPNNMDSSSSDTGNDQEVNVNLNFSSFQDQLNQTYTGFTTSHTLPEKLNYYTRSIHSSTPIPQTSREPVLTFDQASQTDDSALKRDEEIETLVNSLYEEFRNLLSNIEIKEDSSSSDLSEVENSSESDEDVDESHNISTPTYNTSSGEQIVSTTMVPARRMSTETTVTMDINLDTTTVNTSGSNLELIAIGRGNVIVPAQTLEETDWTSYTTATRQLLEAVFPRSVLASHSLSGKPSPAFADRPAKKRLDPGMVEDIVTVVSERCGVDTNLIRDCITTKCADEAKLYRKRELAKKFIRQQMKEHFETTVSSSDDS